MVFKMVNKWLTADSHFGHANIIKYTGRIQFMNSDELKQYNEIMKIKNRAVRETLIYDMKISKDSVDKMNNTMIRNWNQLVKPNDIIYHLGDFAFYSKIDVKQLLLKLNGYKILILGNHDKFNRRDNVDRCIQFMKYLGFDEVYKALHINNFLLIHVPMKLKGVLTLNCGVDIWNFHPIPFPKTNQPMVLTGHVHDLWAYK